MENVVFDLNFLNNLSDEQLDFVLLHETLHCVFKHCTRGSGKLPLLYNIACDIVVNSFILEIFGIDTFTINGEEVMHLAPDDSEGRLHTAEEVYKMLLDCIGDNVEETKEYFGFDSHSEWEKINGFESDQVWNKYIRDSGSNYGSFGSGIPESIRRYINEVSHTPNTNWRQQLHDYIQFDTSDYSFEIPDKRYTDGFILPSFQENICGSSLRDIWIFVDTSGSVDEEGLGIALKEIYSACQQIDNVTGKLFFFDTQVSEPNSFESIEELKTIEPIGGGGTDFNAVFGTLENTDDDELPVLILILTDGYAPFPDEDMPKDIPVVWVIIKSDIEPPWGETVFIS
jgi:predicted metal-dependent peptidase